MLIVSVVVAGGGAELWTSGEGCLCDGGLAGMLLFVPGLGVKAQGAALEPVTTGVHLGTRCLAWSFLAVVVAGLGGNKGGVTRITRCEEYADFSHTYSTEGDLDTATPGVQRMPEGVNTIYGDAYDAIGKPTRYQAGTVKIDRTPPSGTISGIGEGELARDRDYTITGTSADPLSGSRTVQITLDGVQKANRDDCPANDSSCELTWTLDGGDPALSEGTHTLRVNATDQVGNGPRTVATRSFRVERTPPTIDVEGSLKPEDSDWVARGEQDLLFDAFDEGGTGVTSAKLKVDGVTVQEAPAQSCEQGGCALSHDFYPTTDGFAPGEHEVSVEVTDGAGNVATAANTPAARWTMRLERDAPSVALSGSLWDARGQTLEAGRTYALSAVATEPSGGPLSRSSARWSSRSMGTCSRSRSSLVIWVRARWLARSSTSSMTSRRASIRCR